MSEGWPVCQQDLNLIGNQITHTLTFPSSFQVEGLWFERYVSVHRERVNSSVSNANEVSEKYVPSHKIRAATDYPKRTDSPQSHRHPPNKSPRSYVSREHIFPDSATLELYWVRTVFSYACEIVSVLFVCNMKCALWYHGYQR